MGKERRGFGVEDLECRCPSITAVLSNGAGADENEGEAIRCIRNEEAEEFNRSEMGRLC